MKTSTPSHITLHFNSEESAHEWREAMRRALDRSRAPGEARERLRSASAELMDPKTSALSARVERACDACQPIPVADLRLRLVPAPEAQAAGYAQYGGPTLCVDIPDRHFVISAKTTEGRKITFAFLPYRDDAAPQCVDIQRHDTPATVQNGDCVLPLLSAVHFGVRKPDLRVPPSAGYTKVCVLLDNSTYEPAEKDGAK